MIIRKNTYEHIEKWTRENSNCVFVSGEYLGNTSKLNFLCECGNEFSRSWSNFVTHGRNNVCKECGKKNIYKKTTEKRLREIRDIVEKDTNCQLLTKECDKISKDKLSFRCECGNVFNKTWSNFKNSGRCKDCLGAYISKKVTKNESTLIREIYDVVGEEYEYISGYTSSLEKFNIKHVVCGNEYKVTSGKFFNRGQRCPKCFGNKTKTTEEFKEEVRELVGDEYFVVGEYETAKKYILMRHDECMHEYNVVPYAFIAGNRCPKCSSSKGEKRILEYLALNKLDYKHQYRIPSCKSAYPLPFDFGVFKKGKLELIIEYDGEQHYEPMRFNNSMSRFEKTKLHDKIKDDYCFDNNIPLLRIPYWDFENIEEILFDKLVESGIIEEIKI